MRKSVITNLKGSLCFLLTAAMIVSGVFVPEFSVSAAETAGDVEISDIDYAEPDADTELDMNEEAVPQNDAGGGQK